MTSRKIALYSLTMAVLSATVTAQTPTLTADEVLRQHNIPLTRPAVLEALNNPDPIVRSVAAAKLEQEKGKEAIPDITAALDRERNSQTRLNMASLLAHLGNERGLTTLHAICEGRVDQGRFDMEAARLLLDLHDESCFDSVKTALLSDSPDRRVQALMMAPRFVKHAAENRRELTDLIVPSLAHSYPSIRMNASAALARLGAREGENNLKTAISMEHDETVRSMMTRDLQQLQQPKK